MLINKLQINNLRNLQQVELSAHPSVNTLFGANGAGKTSVLESIAMLSRGRSFRSNKVTRIIGDRGNSVQVYAELEKPASNGKKPPGIIRLGIERSRVDWKARKDGEDIKQLSDLAKVFAVVAMEPNSHTLISGSPDVRRRYLDWGVFHVEPQYLDAWRRYARALKQRNAALRAGDVAILESLESVLVAAGETMTHMRTRYTHALSDHLSALLPELSPGLESVCVEYRRGWAADSLAEALQEQRQSDLERGSTHSGPHRADLAIKVDGHVVRDSASRGEQKILATSLVLAQARRLIESGRNPVLLLDDLASEFDNRHFSATLDVGKALGVQIWITGVEEVDPGSPHARFHVEHGRVRKMV